MPSGSSQHSLVIAAEHSLLPPDSPARAGRGGARTAIIEAIRRLTTRAGSEVVTIQEVVDELRRSASPYAESTIRTMMSSHMCAQARGP